MAVRASLAPIVKMLIDQFGYFSPSMMAIYHLRWVVQRVWNHLWRLTYITYFLINFISYHFVPTVLFIPLHFLSFYFPLSHFTLYSLSHFTYLGTSLLYSAVRFSATFALLRFASVCSASFHSVPQCSALCFAPFRSVLLRSALLRSNLSCSVPLSRSTLLHSAVLRSSLLSTILSFLSFAPVDLHGLYSYILTAWEQWKAWVMTTRWRD